MNIEEIKELVSLFDQSTLMEFHLNHEGLDLQLSKRQEYPALAQAQAALVEMEKVVPQPQPVVATPNVNESEVATVSNDAASDYQYITSPIVGVVYLASSPEASPFVEVSQTIHKGQTVCIVEAMKIMNEITSDLEGQVIEVLVENGQMVDFGQRLFAIR